MSSEQLLPIITLSLALHGGVLAASAVAMPPLGDTSTRTEREAEAYELRPFVALAADPEEDEPRPEAAESDPDGRERVFIRTKCGDENGGSMGSQIASARNRRYGVEGPADNPDPHIGRDSGPPGPSPWIFSWLGPPRWSGEPNAPVAVWGRDDSWGNDPRGARGHMWGDDFGDAVGSPGAGIGLARICDTCGANGGGAFVATRTARGGAVGTEKVWSDVDHVAP